MQLARRSSEFPSVPPGLPVTSGSVGSRSAAAASAPAVSPAAAAVPAPWHGAASDALRILLSSLQVRAAPPPAQRHSNAALLP